MQRRRFWGNAKLARIVLLRVTRPFVDTCSASFDKARVTEIGLICDGDRNKWSPIRSVIIRVIDKIGRARSGSLICQSRV